jgi:hypothetical protein
METLCTAIGIIFFSVVSICCAFYVWVCLRAPGRKAAIKQAEADRDKDWRSYLHCGSMWFSEDEDTYWLVNRLKDKPEIGRLRDEWRRRRKADGCPDRKKEPRDE